MERVGGHRDLLGRSRRGIGVSVGELFDGVPGAFEKNFVPAEHVVQNAERLLSVGSRVDERTRRLGDRPRRKETRQRWHGLPDHVEHAPRRAGDIVQPLNCVRGIDAQRQK